MKRLITLGFLTVCLASTVRAEMRTWTSRRGQTLTAELLSSKAGFVKLKREDGQIMSISVYKLSKEDQEFIKAQTAAGAKEPEKAVAALSEELVKLIGEKFVDKSGKKVPLEQLVGKKIALYFSAHWCPPCRQFTPMLVKAYNGMPEEGRNLEIVFVSRDQNEEAMEEYMDGAEMPWVAIPFDSKLRDELSRGMQVKGIPSLIVVDENGKVLSRDVRGMVMQSGTDALTKW